MKTVKTTERYDASGNLIERITETTETFEAIPWYQPYYVPYMPQAVPTIPATDPFKITWTCGNVCGETTTQ